METTPGTKFFPGGRLSQLAYEAVISGAPNARELTDQAAAAYEDAKFERHALEVERAA